MVLFYLDILIVTHLLVDFIKATTSPIFLLSSTTVFPLSSCNPLYFLKCCISAKYCDKPSMASMWGKKAIKSLEKQHSCLWPGLEIGVRWMI